MKLALSFVIAALVSPAWAAPGFDAWAEDVAAQRVRANPIQATVFQYFKGEEQAALDGKFAPVTKAAMLENIARER